MDLYLEECKRTAAPLGLDLSQSAKVTKDEYNMLADKYCEALDNHDEYNMNLYFAALTVRFWRSMTNIYRRAQRLPNQTLFSKGDMPAFFHDWLNEACKYRAWQRPSKDGKPVPSAQQCINQLITSRFGNIRQRECNTNLNKANASTLTMDHVISTDKDGNDKTIGDTIADENSCANESKLGFSVRLLIQDYFNQKRYDMAIIIDAWCNNTSRSPKKSEVRKYINELTYESAEFYAKNYSQNSELIHKVIKTLQKYSAGKLDECIDNVFTEVRAAIQ